MKEIVLDTNVLIRLLIKDVPSQFEKAKDLFAKIEEGKVKGLVSILMVNEVIWILENFYELERGVYIPELLKLLALKNLKIIEVKKVVIEKVLKIMQKEKFDFTDLYLAEIAVAKKILSFDKDFDKIAEVKRVETS